MSNLFVATQRSTVLLSTTLCVCCLWPAISQAQSPSQLPTIKPLGSPEATSNIQKPVIDNQGIDRFDNTRIESIQKRLRLLKEVIDREEATANQSGSNRKPKQPAPELKFPDQPPEVPTPDPNEPPKDDVQYMAVEAKPIDPIQLGDNLFLDGLHDAAYKSYDSIVTRELKEADVAWALCMKACCLRHANSFRKAEPIFRSVVRLELAPSEVKEHASWNLEYLQGRIRSKTDFDDLTTELNELKKRGRDE